jgi:hypothetical protein
LRGGRVSAGSQSGEGRLARGRAPGPRAVIRARPGGVGPQGRDGGGSRSEKGWFSRGSSGGFHGLILASFAHSGKCRDWHHQIEGSPLNHKWGWLKVIRMTGRTGLSDSHVNRCRLGRPLQGRPERPGSSQRRHGVLRACEPRGTDPVLTRMSRLGPGH